MVRAIALVELLILPALDRWLWSFEKVDKWNLKITCCCLGDHTIQRRDSLAILRSINTIYDINAGPRNQGLIWIFVN